MFLNIKLKRTKTFKDTKYGDLTKEYRYNIDVSNEDLESLEGSPKKVIGYFWCDNNKNLESLEGAPEYIGGNFYCYNCPNLKFEEIIKGLINSEIKGNIETDYEEYDTKKELDLAKKIGYNKWLKLFKVKEQIKK